MKKRRSLPKILLSLGAVLALIYFYLILLSFGLTKLAIEEEKQFQQHWRKFNPLPEKNFIEKLLSGELFTKKTSQQTPKLSPGTGGSIEIWTISPNQISIDYPTHNEKIILWGTGFNNNLIVEFDGTLHDGTNKEKFGLNYKPNNEIELTFPSSLELTYGTHSIRLFDQSTQQYSNKVSVIVAYPDIYTPLKYYPSPTTPTPEFILGLMKLDEPLVLQENNFDLILKYPNGKNLDLFGMEVTLKCQQSNYCPLPLYLGQYSCSNLTITYPDNSRIVVPGDNTEVNGWMYNGRCETSNEHSWGTLLIPQNLQRGEYLFDAKNRNGKQSVLQYALFVIPQNTPPYLISLNNTLLVEGYASKSATIELTGYNLDKASIVYINGIRRDDASIQLIGGSYNSKALVTLPLSLTPGEYYLNVGNSTGPTSNRIKFRVLPFGNINDPNVLVDIDFKDKMYVRNGIPDRWFAHDNILFKPSQNIPGKKVPFFWKENIDHIIYDGKNSDGHTLIDPNQGTIEILGWTPKTYPGNDRKTIYRKMGYYTILQLNEENGGWFQNSEADMRIRLDAFMNGVSNDPANDATWNQWIYSNNCNLKRWYPKKNWRNIGVRIAPEGIDKCENMCENPQGTCNTINIVTDPSYSLNLTKPVETTWNIKFVYDFVNRKEARIYVQRVGIDPNYVDWTFEPSSKITAPNLKINMTKFKLLKIGGEARHPQVLLDPNQDTSTPGGTIEEIIIKNTPEWGPSPPPIYPSFSQGEVVTFKGTSSNSWTANEANAGTAADPFNKRCNIIYTHRETQEVIKDLCFFNGDGQGSQTGNIWAARHVFYKKGTWDYKFIAPNIPGLDGESGSINILPMNNLIKGTYREGKLRVVNGKLRHEFSGKYFLKAGADDPENLLSNRETLETMKNIVDNYTAAGVNSFYIIVNTLEADGDDVYPFIDDTPTNSPVFDIKKLENVWEPIFDYINNKGAIIHFVFEDDGGYLGRHPNFNRSIYYSELIARFGHHILYWNVAEEADKNYDNMNSPNYPKIASFANMIRALDSADNNPITVHFTRYSLWESLLKRNEAGSFNLTSIQHSGATDIRRYNPYYNKREIVSIISNIIKLANTKGLALSFDETPRFNDPNSPADKTVRRKARALIYWPLYFNLVNFELHFHAKYGNWNGQISPLDMSPVFKELGYAHNFITSLPNWQDFQPNNALVKNGTTPCSDFRAPCYAMSDGNGNYAVYFTNYDGKKGDYKFDLSSESPTQQFEIEWFNPRTGERTMDTNILKGGAWISLNTPTNEDWAATIRPVGSPPPQPNKPIVKISPPTKTTHTQNKFNNLTLTIINPNRDASELNFKDMEASYSVTTNGAIKIGKIPILLFGFKRIDHSTYELKFPYKTLKYSIFPITNNLTITIRGLKNANNNAMDRVTASYTITK